MGRLQASEMTRLTDIDTALGWHLRYNHYPPVPLSMIAPCKAAIVAYRGENPREEIALPDGITYRGRSTAPAFAIIEQHHLDAFLPGE